MSQIVFSGDAKVQSGEDSCRSLIEAAVEAAIAAGDSLIPPSYAAEWDRMSDAEVIDEIIAAIDSGQSLGEAAYAAFDQRYRREWGASVSRFALEAFWDALGVNAQP